MSNSEHNRADDEIESLRQALDEETHRSLEAKRTLDRANAGFEKFVTTAAHNLREPLRDVASFSQLLAEACAASPDAETRVYLTRIQEGAARMQSLLTDVVDYWTIDAGAGMSCRTDMDAVLRQALVCAEKQIAARRAVVTQDPLLPVWGDFEILAKVMCHLIRNAIEYCDTAAPRVHISSKRVDLDCAISVRDNGPGIEPAFQRRIFEPFQRLHGREHPGSGLGLAFCNKAVEAHGGRMWVESTPGAGSTFYFALPAAD
jgi:light-regulated signal transduction histidine kinase (bacteriophytochrome)